MFKLLLVVLSVLSLHAMDQRKESLKKDLCKVTGKLESLEGEAAAQRCSSLSRCCATFMVPTCYALSGGDGSSLSYSDLFVRFVTGLCMHESLNSLAECEDTRARARFSEVQYENLLRRRSCIVQELKKLELKQD